MSRTAPTRMPELMSSDRSDLDTLLDKTVLAHIAFVSGDGTPALFPTMAARWGDRILVHGSTGSTWMRQVAAGIPVAVSLAVIDGIVVARSAYESSLLYSSAVLFGSFAPVAAEEKEAALEVFTNRLLPGRAGEVRHSTARELAATMLLAMPIGEWSLRGNDGWPDDPQSDISGPAWAGHIRFTPPGVTVTAAPDLRAGIPVPASISAVRGVR